MDPGFLHLWFIYGLVRWQDLHLWFFNGLVRWQDFQLMIFFMRFLGIENSMSKSYQNHKQIHKQIQQVNP